MNRVSQNISHKKYFLFSLLLKYSTGFLNGVAKSVVKEFKVQAQLICTKLVKKIKSLDLVQSQTKLRGTLAETRLYLIWRLTAKDQFGRKLLKQIQSLFNLMDKQINHINQIKQLKI